MDRGKHSTTQETELVEISHDQLLTWLREEPDLRRALWLELIEQDKVAVSDTVAYSNSVMDVVTDTVAEQSRDINFLTKALRRLIDVVADQQSALSDMRQELDGIMAYQPQYTES